MLDILGQVIMGTGFTLFMAAVVLDIFFTLRGDYDHKRKMVDLAPKKP
jgi:hypothetical protein